MATYNKACRFGLDPGALDRANDEVLGVVQIESAAAVADADQIAGVDGVDVLFVGPRDLSHDLGVPGDLTAPAFTEAAEHVLAACRRHGKACGLLVTDGAAPPGGSSRAGPSWPSARTPPCSRPRSAPSSAGPAPHPSLSDRTGRPP